MPPLLALLLVMATGSPLAPCPATPNCVSSQATDHHFIAPLPFSGTPAGAFARLLAILEQRPDTTMVTATGQELRVEFTTALGFIDDGHFVLDAANSTIQLRSASRQGSWDLGKNRRRLEGIRRQFLGQ